MQDRREYNPWAGKKWITRGLIWGFGLFAIIYIILPLTKNEEIVFFDLLKGLLLFAGIGLAYGYIMKNVWSRTSRKKPVNKDDIS